MESVRLRYFCDVVALGSFTKAAERAYISQSAMSQQVRALEEEIGVELLERSGRRFSPTAAGALLARRGSELLERLDALEAEVVDLAEGKPRHLTVGYLNRYEGWEVAAAIAAFTRRHPGCEVDAVAGTHDQLYRGMLAGRIDVSLNDVRRALSPDWENRHLMTGYRCAEVSEASAVADKESVTCRDLAASPCIVVCAPEQREAECAWWRDIMGFSGEFLFAAGTDEARMMVAGNRGWLPVETREATPRSSAVVRRLPLVDAAGSSLSDYYVFWPKERTGPLVEEFAEILEGLFR